MEYFVEGCPVVTDYLNVSLDEAKDMATWAVANDVCDRVIVRDQFGAVLFQHPLMAS
jgi:hypothetical protein